MAKRIPEAESDDILKIVAQYSEGVAVDSIHTRLAKPVPRRTLQYRLAKLVATEKLPAADQPRFVEVAEIELMNLHEGNIARYKLRPAEYRTWQENWK